MMSSHDAHRVVSVKDVAKDLRMTTNRSLEVVAQRPIFIHLARYISS